MSKVTVDIESSILQIEFALKMFQQGIRFYESVECS